MFKSLMYVLKENFTNLYRIFSITKYELVSDMRDSKLGWFWNFADPTIQVLTYWFVFGYIMNRGQIDGIPFIFWLLGGVVVWFFISPCITSGCNAIFSKSNVISKMKFPVSILPTTLVFKELFNHVCIMIVLVSAFMIGGYYPSIHWLGILYYLLCAIILGIAISLNTSVLNMLARDTSKFIRASMRMLFYLTPILWDIPTGIPTILRYVIKVNPIYYVVQGYRDCFFYQQGLMYYWKEMIAFWVITFALLLTGSSLMYKFKFKFIDLV